MANYLRNNTRRDRGTITRKPNGSICFVGYDGELHRVLPGEAGAVARAVLIETIIRVWRDPIQGT